MQAAFVCICCLGMNPLKRLAGDTAWYGISNILGRMVNYLLVPLYTTKGILDPVEYGVIREMYAWVALLNILYTFSLETTYFRFASKEAEGRVFNQACTFILVLSLAFSVSLVLLATPLMQAMQYEGREIYLYWLAAIIAIDAFLAIPFAQLRWQKKAKQFALAKLFNIGLNIGLNVFFLLFCKSVYEGAYLPDWRGFIATIYLPEWKEGYVFLANLLANACLILLLWPALRRYRFVWDTTLLKPMLRYAYPLVLMGLAGQINLMSDFYFIKYYMPDNLYPQVAALVPEGKSEQQYMLGVYNACIKFAVFMLLVVQAYRYAAEPFFFSKAEDKNSPQLFAKAMHWFIIAGCVIFLGVCSNLSWLKYLLVRNPEYYIGLSVVPFALLGNLLVGIYFNLSIWFKLSDKTEYGTYLSFIGAGITIVSNLALVPFWGIEGVAFSLVFTYTLMSALCYYWGQKHFPIPYFWKQDLAYLLLACVLVGLQGKISFDASWLNFLAHNSLLLFFVGIVWLFENLQYSFSRKSL